MLYKTSELQKLHLDTRDGSIGSIKDLLFDDEMWTIRYIVADTGRWLPGRRVLLSPACVLGLPIGKDHLPVDLTKAQVENSPGEAVDQPVSEQHQRDIHTYYGWTAYWSAAPYPVAGVMAGPGYGIPAAGVSKAGARAKTSGDPHLRSVNHVKGYAIHATDGTIGHVEDFLVDLEAWSIRALIVDTRNWLPGRKVVVSPETVDRVSWTDSEVNVLVTREFIKESPEYSTDMELSPDFERSLHSSMTR